MEFFKGMGVGIWPIGCMPIQTSGKKIYQYKLTKRELVSVCGDIVIESHQRPGWHTICHDQLAYEALQVSCHHINSSPGLAFLKQAPSS